MDPVRERTRNTVVRNHEMVWGGGGGSVFTLRESLLDLNALMCVEGKISGQSVLFGEWE
jgi:hypothetical protein